MENQLTEEQLKEIASQLSCPKGEAGIKTAKLMSVNNQGMIESTINCLNLTANDVVLEIGFGNASHLPYLLEKANHLKYFGVDISATMIEEASKINIDFVKNNQAHFYLIDSEELPFPNLRFDKIFTVNTIYFWYKPDEYLLEMKRVLKHGGKLAIGFADKTFMKKLEFTQYDFTLYHKEVVETLLLNAGFKNIETESKQEQVQTNAQQIVTRDYWVITGEI